MGLGNQWVPVGSRLRDHSVSREVFRSGLGLRGLLVWGAKLVWVVRLVWVARGIGEGVHIPASVGLEPEIGLTRCRDTLRLV